MVVLYVKWPSLNQKLARDWLLNKLYLVDFKSNDESKLLMQGVVQFSTFDQSAKVGGS